MPKGGSNGKVKLGPGSRALYTTRRFSFIPWAEIFGTFGNLWGSKTKIAYFFKLSYRIKNYIFMPQPLTHRASEWRFPGLQQRRNNGAGEQHGVWTPRHLEEEHGRFGDKTCENMFFHMDWNRDYFLLLLSTVVANCYWIQPHTVTWLFSIYRLLLNADRSKFARMNYLQTPEVSVVWEDCYLNKTSDMLVLVWKRWWFWLRWWGLSPWRQAQVDCSTVWLVCSLPSQKLEYANQKQTWIMDPNLWSVCHFHSLKMVQI